MRTVIVAAFATAIASSSVNAEPIELRFGGTVPAPAVQNKLIFDPWIEKINAEADGAVEIVNTYNNLANPMTVYDAVTSGTLDIGWVLHGFTPGRFPKSSVVQVPFQSETAEEASYALWDLYEDGMIADEYDNVKVFAIHGFPQAAYHSKEPVKSLDDLEGVKTRISSKMLADVISALGGNPVSLPSPNAYEHLNNGLVDADFVQWTIVCVGRINEAANYHLEGPLGGQGAMMIMNLDRWESLPDEVKEVLEANSGKEFALQNGRYQDQINRDCRQETAEMPNQHIREISDEELRQWKEAVDPVIESWVDRTPNGQKLLEAFQDAVAEFRSAD